MQAITVKINPSGDPLWIDIRFKGLAVASYEYQLFHSSNNQVLQHFKGNNQNPEDDFYYLPVPVSSNINRLIDVRSNFVGLDPVNYKEFEAKVEIYQGRQKLGEVNEKGELSGLTQISQLFIIIE